jgi:hypothetical protein
MRSRSCDADADGNLLLCLGDLGNSAFNRGTDWRVSFEVAGQHDVEGTNGIISIRV